MMRKNGRESGCIIDLQFSSAGNEMERAGDYKEEEVLNGVKRY